MKLFKLHTEQIEKLKGYTKKESKESKVKTKKMEEISTCLHRFLDPIDIEHAPEGCGNCAICINNARNKECSQYTPVLVSLPHMKLPTWI